MKLAMQLALKGKGQTSPNPMVGAVIVKKGKIIAEGWHQRFGGPHAEVLALREAGAKARGATMYVTLEPCAHFGKTPPCVDQIIASGIQEVVVGMTDPNPRTFGHSITKMEEAGLQVRVGVLEDELWRMNEVFIKYITSGMPFIVGKVAQTLDGKIATAAGQSKWITSEETRTFTHQLRNEFDAIMVGVNTVLKDNPSLEAWPQRGRRAKPLVKIVVDTHLRIRPRAKLLMGTAPTRCILATTKDADIRKVNTFRQKGVQVIICPKRRGKVHLPWLFRELARRDIAYILIEGGAKLIGEALRAKLVDKMLIFIALKILGDQTALSAIDNIRVRILDKAIKLKAVTVQNIDQDIFVEGYLDY